MARCTHVRSGIVTNQDPRESFDRERPHASVTTCEREACMNASLRWVAGETNETATYFRDGWQGARR